MEQKHRNFDADKLMDLKNRHCGYAFCPWCSKMLREKFIDGVMRMACDDDECGFIFYQNPIPAAGGVIVEDDNILLVKRAHPPKIGWWCFPAGFMEWGEHPTDTAIREVEEETGLKVRLKEFFEVYSGTDDPRVNAILILYIAERISGDLKPSDDAEEARFWPLDALPEKIAFESHYRALRDYNRRYRQQK